MINSNSKNQFKDEVLKGNRFEFGKNWKEFLELLNPKMITEAEDSLKKMLNITTLEGKSFLDIGSGSGLFSLAAKNLGATVTSFDYDTDSVSCTNFLRDKYYKNDTSWVVLQASVLDNDFIESLPLYDYVYSWGVLHHTGEMHNAIINAMSKVKINGFFYVALYRKTIFDFFWKKFKKYYTNQKSEIQKFYINLWINKIKFSFLLKGRNFNKMILEYNKERGMDFYKDIHDWLGGYPYEAITPKECKMFFDKHNFKLVKEVTITEGISLALSSGCDEFLFNKL